MQLQPAYGRDYSSGSEIVEDLNANKDFILNDLLSPWDGKYISLVEVVRYYPKQETVKVRYSELSLFCFVTFKEGKATLLSDAGEAP